MSTEVGCNLFTSTTLLYMAKKIVSYLLVVFAIAVTFAHAKESNTSLNPIQEEASLKSVVVSVDLANDRDQATLSSEESKIILEKGQDLTILVHGAALSRYELVYGTPDDYPEPKPSIYYKLKNPWSQTGWYDWLHFIPVLKEQIELNTITDDSLALHFTASNVGTKEITVCLFDETSALYTNPAYSTTYTTVASCTFTVTVK